MVAESHQFLLHCDLMVIFLFLFPFPFVFAVGKGHGGIFGEPDAEEPDTEISESPSGDEPTEIGGGVEYTEIGEPVKGLPGTRTFTPSINNPQEQTKTSITTDPQYRWG